MAIRNKTVEIQGSASRVSLLQIWPQSDGTVVIVVTGQTEDDDGNIHTLEEAQIVFEPGVNDAVAVLLVQALDALRKVNGLEDAAITLEPVVKPNIPE